MPSPRSKRPQIETSRLDPAVQIDQLRLSAHSERSHGNSSIPSGHPSATSSKAGTPVAETESYLNGFTGASRLPIPSRPRPRTIRSVSGPSLKDDSLDPPPTEHNLEDRQPGHIIRSSTTSSRTTRLKSPATALSISRPPSRSSEASSPSGSPLRYKPGETATRPSFALPTIASENRMKRLQGSAASDIKGEHNNYSQNDSPPLLGPTLPFTTDRATSPRRTTEQRNRSYGRVKDTSLPERERCEYHYIIEIISTI